MEKSKKTPDSLNSAGAPVEPVAPAPEKPKKNSLMLVGVALLVLGLAGSLLIYRNNHKAAPGNTAKTSPAPSQVAAVKTADAQVSLASAGFMPASLRLKTGSQVTWTNTDTVGWILSSSQLPDMDSDAINPKDSYSFTFDKAGTYTISTTTASSTPVTNTMTITVTD